MADDDPQGEPSRDEERQLEAANDRWELIFDAVHEPLVVVDENRVLRAINRQARLGLGLGPEWLGRPLQRLAEREPWSTAARLAAAVMAGGAALEARAEDAAADQAWQITVGPLIPQRDEAAWSLVALPDVSELERRTRALRESEDRFRSLADAAPVLIWMADPDGRFTYFNRGWLAFTGRSLEEELGTGFVAGVHEEDREALPVALGRALDERAELSLEFRLRRHDGEYRWLLTSGAPRFSEDGAFLGFIGSCTDITARRLVATRLAETSEQLGALIESLPDAVILKDAQGRYQSANRAARTLLELEAADWVGRTDLELAALRPAWRAAHQALHESDERARAAGGRLDSVDLLPDATGVPRYLEARRVPLADTRGEHRSLITLGRNATDRRLGEEALRLAATVFESSPDGIMVTDTEGRILRVNRSFSRITGYLAEEVVGRTPRILQSGRHDREFYAAMWRAIGRTGQWRGEIWNRRKSGEAYPEWLGISAVHGAAGQTSHYVGTFSDLSGQKQVEAEILRLTRYDALTGLPNRRQFEDGLAGAVSLLRPGAGLALVLLDVDHFAGVNAGHGHPAGDALLAEIATRLRRAAGKDELVARWHGDEFALLLHGDGAEQASSAFAALDTLRRVFDEPFPLPGGGEMDLDATMGIALFPRDAATPPLLVRAAETALHDGKAAARGGYRFYAPDIQVLSGRRLSLERDLRGALERSELSVVYEPRVDAGGRLVGAEARHCWTPAGREPVPPSRFLPVAEESGLMGRLTRLLVADLCAALARWTEAGLAPVRVSFAVAPSQLARADFTDAVLGELRRTGLPASQLGFEVTEAALSRGEEAALVALRRHRELGFELSLAGLGTHLSSLASVRRFSFDVLKLDRSLVGDLPGDPATAAVLTAVTGMARGLGVRAVAEGVSNAAQAEFLRAQGCSGFQGPLYGVAVPADTFQRSLSRG